MTSSLVDNKYKIDKNPDTCPACGKGISPICCYSYDINNWRTNEEFLQVVYRCPQDSCSRLFIAKFIKSNSYPYSDTFNLNRSYLLDLFEFEDFPDSIKNISEMFTKIYNQAKIAEDNNLALVAGPGYRKALEFLVKDYLIRIQPSDSEIIKKETLSSTIKRIEEKRIEACASRAYWVGNDETHYVRKWENKDIEDLKNLIRMIIDWIDLVERSDEYEKAMPSKPQEEHE